MSGIARTLRALSDSWRDRDSDATKGYTRREAQFLDALMEIEESPPSPLARWLLWMLVAMVASAAVWSYHAQLDIVAEARGKVRPEDETKVVQAAVEGKVSALYARNGMSVTEGQVLVELDRVGVDAEIARLTSAIGDALLDEASSRLLAGVPDAPGAPTPTLATLAELAGLPRELVDERQAVMDGRLGELLAQLGQKDAELETHLASKGAHLRQAENVRARMAQRESQHGTELRARQEEVASRKERVRIVGEELARYKALVEAGVYSMSQLDGKRLEMVDAERLLTEARRGLEMAGELGQGDMVRLEGELAEHVDGAAEMDAHHARVLSERELAREAFKRQATDAWLEARERLRILRQDLVKARRLALDHEVVSPVDGVVEQLAVHSAGAVVTPAQPLMVVVPSGARLYAEVLVENKDVGHLVVGQDVALKLDAFPHHRYGLVQGTLLDVSDDADRGPAGRAGVHGKGGTGPGRRGRRRQKGPARARHERDSRDTDRGKALLRVLP